MTKITKQKLDLAIKEINKLQKQIDYDTRDFPISFIVEQFTKEDYYIPDYQRTFVWPEDYKTRFIESLILGYPIPLLFLSDTASGRLEIVDGVQRISTLSDFLTDKIKLSKLKTLKTLNGFLFSDLPLSEQRRLNSKSLRTIVLKKNTDVTTRTDLFDRLNTSSYTAKPAEVRHGSLTANPLMKLINELAENQDFLKVIYLSENKFARREDAELVSRFFAYSNNYKKFNHGVRTFINEYIVFEGDDFSSDKKTEFKKEFVRTMKFANKHLPDGFKKYIQPNRIDTPRVRFEALAVGINLALRINPKLNPSKETINDLLNSAEFEKLTTSDASNSKTKVVSRIEFVRDFLLGDNKSDES